MRRALVVGSTGQDGSYLVEQLQARGVTVLGISRRTTPTCDVRDANAVRELVAGFSPDAVFYLAAYHGSSEAKRDENPEQELADCRAIHVEAWEHILKALTRHAPQARAFYASSSHVFGEPAEPIQDESTPFAPRSPYAITKAAGMELARQYRERGLFVACGILYNHESPRRGPSFVSQRIARGAVDAQRAATLGKPYALELGSLSSIVDWGYAPEYTEAMIRTLGVDTPADYVVATGIPHSALDFCEAAFAAVDLDWKRYVTERPQRITRVASTLIGNAAKLRRATGWHPTVSFQELVHLLVTAAAKPAPTP